MRTSSSRSIRIRVLILHPPIRLAAVSIILETHAPCIPRCFCHPGVADAGTENPCPFLDVSVGEGEGAEVDIVGGGMGDIDDAVVGGDLV
jgi:hypothetical protein